jgi:hypothetical protein
MINDEIKIMLGEAAGNFTEEQIGLCAKRALAEVEAYCKCSLDYELEAVAADIAVIKLQRLNTEGLAGMSVSGVAETYIDGYPANIMAVLNRKRKIKVL